MDMMVPWVHDFAYEGLLKDVLEVPDSNTVRFSTATTGTADEREVRQRVPRRLLPLSRGAVLCPHVSVQGTLDDRDTMWLHLRHLHIGDVTTKLQAMTPLFNDLGSQTSVDGLRAAMQVLGTVQESRQLYVKHFALAQAAVAAASKQHLHKWAAVVRCCCCGCPFNFWGTRVLHTGAARFRNKPWRAVWTGQAPLPPSTGWLARASRRCEQTPPRLPLHHLCFECWRCSCSPPTSL